MIFSIIGLSYKNYVSKLSLDCVDTGTKYFIPDNLVYFCVCNICSNMQVLALLGKLVCTSEIRETKNEYIVCLVNQKVLYTSFCALLNES